VNLTFIVLHFLFKHFFNSIKTFSVVNPPQTDSAVDNRGYSQCACVHACVRVRVCVSASVCVCGCVCVRMPLFAYLSVCVQHKLFQLNYLVFLMIIYLMVKILND